MSSHRSPFQAARAWMGVCFHCFVFAAYPVLVVLGANAGVLPLHASVVARTVAVTSILTAALLFALRPVIPDLTTRAASLTFVFIAFNLYAIVGGTSTSAFLAALYIAASVGLSALIVRPWRTRPRTSRPLNFAAGAVLAVNLYTFVPAVADTEPWRPAADALIGQVADSGAPPSAGARSDIYYVILDGFGRPDILQARYGLDLADFVAALEARGFVVPARSQSNYAQTYLSLASSLNLSYLDTIATSMQGSADRRALDHLIQNNALMKLARRAGYRVVAIGSDYAATERLAAADHCHCEQFGLHEIESTAINLTPLRALPLNRWTYGAHRRKIEESLRHLRGAATEAGPKLVFAHLLAPHPPFVFGAGGGPIVNEARMFSFSDGSQYPGSHSEYAAGYRDQAGFVAGQVLSAIDAILSRPGPSPVIVIHGDHGPGSTWDWKDLRGEKGRERMGILSAYRLPGDERPRLHEHVTPVNALRTLANRHLGTSLPPLPDVSFTSTWKQPYQFEVIGPDHAPSPSAAAPAGSTARHGGM